MTLRIGIVGGGIGGLTLAVALSRLNLDTLVEVDIYESAPELTQIGAGITFWPRAWKIFGNLGLEAALASHLSPGQHVPDGKPRLAFQFRKADQKEGVPIRDLVFAALSFHRAIVQQVLLEHLSPSFRCHLSSRLVSYSASKPGSDSSIELIFENGKTATCDLLVGADGIKSIVRKQFVAENITSKLREQATAELVWSGTFAYRCMVDSRVLVQKMPGHRALSTPVVYCGKNKHLVAYPILQGRVVNIAAYVSDTGKEGTIYDGPSFQDVPKEEVIPIFDEWEEEVRVLVHNAEKPSRWAIHAIRPLEKYASGAVVLLGDAAHAMAPHQGNGAGQAIEVRRGGITNSTNEESQLNLLIQDAYILAHLVAKAVQNNHTTPITDVTRVYDRIRRPFANFVHGASRTHGLLYEFNASGFEDVQEGDDTVEAERLAKLGELIVGDWEYAWLTTAEGDLERALGML
ncbi:FAD/NAD-P-binding domain-containing protein [Flammula alnicola]|nr:FAD/NAD-P-binding domain-containing protein [Flammula alnicola]